MISVSDINHSHQTAVVRVCLGELTLCAGQIQKWAYWVARHLPKVAAGHWSWL